MTASQKVHLRRCASSCVIAAYFYVRLIPQDSRALHLELFTVPSNSVTFCEVILIECLKCLKCLKCLMKISIEESGYRSQNNNPTENTRNRQTTDNGLTD